MNHVFCSLDIRVSSNFAHKKANISLKLFVVTDVGTCCKERKIKLFKYKLMFI